MKSVDGRTADDVSGRWWYGLLLLGVVVLCYARALTYPHIQDDWRLLSYLHSGPSAGELMRLIFDPSGTLFFRPLSRLYHLASHALFGLHAAGFHTFALLWLWGGSWLLARVVHAVTASGPTACAAGLLYAAATSIHMDSMLWEAGVNELAGAFFVWLSMLLFLNAHYRRAAAAWLAALLFKEAGIFLPAVLLIAHARPGRACARSGTGARGIVRAFAPFAVALALYAIPKAANLNAARLPDEHPYRIAFLPAPFAKNAASYAKWTVDALFPYAAEAEWKNSFFDSLAARPGAVVVVFAGLAALLLVRRRADVRRRNAFLAAWVVLGLAPVLFLPNHVYRYYLTYSLPPLVVLFLFAARGLFARLGPRGSSVALGLLIVTNVVFSARYFWRRDAEGLGARYSDGTNLLVKRGQTVNIVREGLLSMRPTLPPGSTLIFDGVELESFDWHHGPRVWYGDPSLVVLPLAHVRVHRKASTVETPDYGVLLRMGPAGRQTVELRRGSTFAFKLQDRRLIDVTDDFFASIGM